jgi:hypothetical protein
VIAYYSQGREGHGGGYSHSALYLGNNKIACHTYCRSDKPECTWDNDWNLGADGGYGYTFINMPS